MANWRLIQKEQPLLRYRDTGAMEEGMGVLLKDSSLDALAEHFRHLLDDEDANRQTRARDIAEWLHWMSYIISAQKSPRLANEEDARRWLRKQVSGGIASASL